VRETRGRSLTVRPLARGVLHLPSRLPVDPYRHGLYTAAELYDTPTYADSLDARVYAWTREPPGHDDTLARALHDHAIDEALCAWVEGRRLVGVMGGHAMERGTSTYADTAHLGAALGARFTIATGGGPGAMEAANLGARCAAAPPEVLATALDRLSTAPSFRPSIDAWAGMAREVLAQLPEATETLGVPTWFYGHEPPNLFATAIAKYVRNSQREAILLQVCDAGIVFLPGAAGTVQEIFQDACENYYAEPESVAPMVLVGADYWTSQLPAWPLLQALGTADSMAAHLHLVDSVEEAAQLLLQEP
jgi:predicted Rossmann-fold nucleotide-binding protein